MNEALNYQFDHIHIMCTDLDATVQWLVDGVGAELVARRDSMGTPSAQLCLAGVNLLVRNARPGEQLEVVPSPRYGEDHIGLKVADVDAAVAELRRRGVTIDVEPRDIGPELRIAFVRGPDNLRIELLQPKGGK